MHDDNDPHAESQDTPEQAQQEETGDLTLFKASIPERTFNNAKKAVTNLMTPFWSDFKNFSHASMEAATARLQLSRARSEQQILQIAHESDALRKGLLNIAEDQALVDEVTLRAVQYIGEKHGESLPKEEAGEIATAWLRRFRKEVEGLGDEDMKEAFSRVLAGEIEQPGSFSIHTLRTLGTLDQHTAELFRKAASIALVMFSVHDAPYARLFGLSSDFQANMLEPYGLDYEFLTILTEKGLLQGDYSSVATILPPFQFLCQNQRWVLLPVSDKGKTSQKLTGAGFTTVGTELVKIAEIEPNPAFLQALKVYFATLQLDMVRFPQQQGGA